MRTSEAALVAGPYENLRYQGWAMNLSRNQSSNIYRSFRRFALLCPLLLGLAAGVTRAQGEASISGVVSDATGSAIAGASVKIESVETGGVRSLVTDLAGRYDAPLLPVGSYKLTVEKTGFRSESKTGITLVVGERAAVDFSLTVGELRETVTVTWRLQALGFSIFTSRVRRFFSSAAFSAEIS